MKKCVWVRPNSWRKSNFWTGRSQIIFGIRSSLDFGTIKTREAWSKNTQTIVAESARNQMSSNELIGCAVKRRWSTAGVYPPGNWFAPPGSNQSSSGGNETAEASGAEGREGDSASV